MEINRRTPFFAFALALILTAAAAPLAAQAITAPPTARPEGAAAGQETAAEMPPAAGQPISAVAAQTAAGQTAGKRTAAPNEDTARSLETTQPERPAFTAGLLLEVPLLRAIGMANIYVPGLPVQPRLALGYGDIQILLTAAPLRLADGWEEGPYYAAFSASVLLSPQFGLYHPQAGVEAWFSSLPRSSPEDAWEILPGDPPSDDTDFFQSYCVRAAPLRFGFDIGPVSIDVSLFDFFYGPVIPLTVYPGFRVAGTSVIWVNYCSFSVIYRWEGR